MNNTRIPRTIILFNLYIGSVVSYLKEGTPTNAERLGILPEELAIIEAIALKWATLHPLYVDKKTSRTIEVTQGLHTLIHDFVDLDQSKHLLNRVAASPYVTTKDLDEFNIKQGANTSARISNPTAEIKTHVIPVLEAITGGKVSVRCKNDVNNKTAIVDGANCVQYRYCIGSEAPIDVSELAMSQDISTRASFTLDLGTPNTSQNLFIYFRWVNTIHQDLNGPWSTMYTTIII